MTHAPPSRSGPPAPAWVALCLIAALLACNFPGQPVTPTPSSTGRATSIQEITGEAVIRQSVGGTDSAAAVGQVVPPGGQVITQGDSGVKLGLPEAGSFIRMGPDTSLTLLQLGQNESGPVSRFGLLEGKVWVVLDPAAGGEGLVETPGGNASARGQMSVEYYSNYAGTGAPLFLVTCLSGVCSVDNAFGGATLAPGQQTEVVGTNTGPTAPHPMDPEQLADWQSNVPELGQAGDATPTHTYTPSPAAVPTTETPAPGVTPPTATFTSTPSNTPSPTPLGPPFVILTDDANIRGGPGTVYIILGVLQEGEQAAVLGQDQTRTWYVIVFPRSPDGRGWVWSQLVTLGGDTSNIPIIAAPPTPTYTPTATFTPTLTFTPSLTPTITQTVIYPNPTINADPNPVTNGCDPNNTTISWDAPGAISATINSQTVAVPRGSMLVCILQDITYTLVATYPGGGQKSASVNVDMDYKP